MVCVPYSASTKAAYSNTQGLQHVGGGAAGCSCSTGCQPSTWDRYVFVWSEVKYDVKFRKIIKNYVVPVRLSFIHNIQMLENNYLSV